MGPTVWELFVDESGDFDEASEKVVVAGVLIPAHRIDGREDEIRSELARLVPGFPWPLHISVVRRISTPVVAHLALRIRAVKRLVQQERKTLAEALDAVAAGRSPDPGTIAALEQRLHGNDDEFQSISLDIPKYLTAHHGQLKTILQTSGGQDPLPEPLWTGTEWGSEPTPGLARAAAFLLQHARDFVVSAAQQMIERWHPEFGILAYLDEILREKAPRRAQTLRGMKNRSIAAIHRWLQTMADPAGGETAFLVVASESRPGDFAPPGDGTDRYLSLLEAMLTRVAEVLNRRDGSHQVRVRVATRLLPSASSDPRHAEHFSLRRHLVPLCQRIQTEREFPNVQFQPAETPIYRTTTHPGWVFVDYAANAARFAIDNLPLCEVEERAVRETGLPIRSGDPPRTHAQAAGSAWKVLSARRIGAVQAVALPPDIWPWAFEQAMEWGQP